MNNLNSSVLTKNQKKTYGYKFYSLNGQKYRIKANVRYDDQGNNGKNTFAITGEIERQSLSARKESGGWKEDAYGCCHDEIAKHFPELANFIKWHLTSSNGPLYYIENTLYLAGNRDCCGLLEGEQGSYGRIGKGKERELDAARSTAVWSEATDEQLSLPPEELKALLEARHEKLIEQFKVDIESLGFVY